MENVVEFWAWYSTYWGSWGQLSFRAIFALPRQYSHHSTKDGVIRFVLFFKLSENLLLLIFIKLNKVFGFKWRFPVKNLKIWTTLKIIETLIMLSMETKVMPGDSILDKLSQKLCFGTMCHRPFVFGEQKKKIPEWDKVKQLRLTCPR